MTGSTPAELRRERRAFVTTAHPDRGGDGGAFAAGLRDLDARIAAQAGPPPRVTAVRRVGAPRRLLAQLRRRRRPARVH